MLLLFTLQYDAMYYNKQSLECHTGLTGGGGGVRGGGGAWESVCDASRE